MKKIAAIALACSFLAGCATYKFAPGKDPYDKGYVAWRDGYAIPEYTVGKESTVPDDLGLAKERFKRRRSMVEYYYKKMGYIENRFRENFWDRGVLMVKFMVAPLRLPFVAVDNYRYEHNSDYRRRVQARLDEEDLKEEVRISKIKESLKQYVLEDVAREEGIVLPAQEAPKKQPPSKKVKAVKQEKPKKKPVAVKQEPLPEPSPAVSVPEEAVARQPAERPVKTKKPLLPRPSPVTQKTGSISAVISARPISGSSPLRVHFRGDGSRSSLGRIISYEWDFGDGDTSILKNPVNTYWSTLYGTKTFTVILTIHDDAGNVATATKAIDVTNN